MATAVMMRHPATGQVRKGLVGFSWTTLFFNGLPAMIRGDIVSGIAMFAAACCTFAISNVAFAFLYNKYYTTKLLKKGYEFADTAANIQTAKRKLGLG